MQNTEWEIDCYGCTEEQLKTAMRGNLLDPFDLVNLAASITSDAQEVLARGQTETARQYMNRAKYFMFEATTILRQMETKNASN
jgi:hypothetical protein